MRKNYKLFILSAVLLASLASCELYNPAEPTPAYIHIQKIDVVRNLSGFVSSGDEGSLSSKISDAWVYVDDQLIGCFELPATFPVIAEGSHRVMVRPGIKVNGIAANRAPYPFYNKFEQTVDFKIGTTTTLSPTTSYLSTTNFSLKEDFESVGIKIDRTTNSDTSFQLISSPDPNVFEGNKSSIAYLDASRTFFECTTVNPVVLPTHGSPVFLEFNYKSNYQFTVSIIAIGAISSQQFLVLHLNPSSTWNKTYLYLTPAVSGASSAINYKIEWGIVNNTAQDSVALLMDNIKLISF